MKRSSPLLPSKTSLADDCTRVLAQRIRQGEWPLALPGERRLAEILQVGRDTLRRSLTELTLQGLLEPCAHGRKRLIKSHLIAEERPQPTTLRMARFLLEKLAQVFLGMGCIIPSRRKYIEDDGFFRVNRADMVHLGEHVL